MYTGIRWRSKPPSPLCRSAGVRVGMERRASNVWVVSHAKLGAHWRYIDVLPDVWIRVGDGKKQLGTGKRCSVLRLNTVEQGLRGPSGE